MPNYQPYFAFLNPWSNHFQRVAPAFLQVPIEVRTQADHIKRVIVLPEGDRIVTISANRTLRLYSILTRTCLKLFTGIVHGIVDIAPVGEDKLISLDLDGMICLWNISDGKLLQMIELRCAVHSMQQIAYRRLLHSGSTGCLWQFDWNRNRLGLNNTRRLEPEHLAMSSIASCGDRFMISFYNMSPVQLWETPGMSCIAKLPTEYETVTCVALNDRYCITGNEQGGIRVFDAQTLRCVQIIQNHGGRITGLELTWADRLISSGADQKIMIHGLLTGRLLWTQRLYNTIGSVAVLPGGRIVCGMQGGIVIIVTPPRPIASLISSPQ